MVELPHLVLELVLQLLVMMLEEGRCSASESMSAGGGSEEHSTEPGKVGQVHSLCSLPEQLLDDGHRQASGASETTTQSEIRSYNNPPAKQNLLMQCHLLWI